MIYGKFKKHDFIQLRICIIIYFFLLLLLVFIASNFRLYMKDYSPNNLFYVHLINYTMPAVKTVSFEEEDISESEGTLSQQIVKIAGLNIYDPIKLMGKEMAFIKSLTFNNEDMETPEITFNINPFNFDESKIVRASEKQTTETVIPSNSSVNVVNKNIKRNINKAKPEVLIYHTHTTESFSTFGNYNTDYSKNITSVGSIVANELENTYGIAVIHDKTIHNSSMIKAYQRSGETLNKYLNQYGSFKLIVDMHRDGGPTKAATTARLNNENLAKIMFVLSKQSQYFDKNQEATRKLLSIANQVFPSFSRDLIIYKEKGYYNQNKSPNTVLVEVGSEKNTLEEAQNSGKYIARIIAEYINSK